MIKVTQEDDRIYYRLNGVYHRPNGPAVDIRKGYTSYWFLFGNRHRYYGPASTANDWFWIHDERVK